MIKRLLSAALRKRLATLRNSTLGPVLAALAKRRLQHRGEGRAHGLPGELIVSLTSYPARFGTLHLTLGCLLDQTVKPDRLILWIAHDDMAQLPPAVLALEKSGLEIRTCDDLRSFKKLVPALEAFPDAFIATADDDIFFRRHWLEALADGFEPGVIACHRAHRMKRSADGRLEPYLDWDFDVQDSAARMPSSDIMPTGGAGALYTPKSLDPRVTEREQFQHLCPDGDDLWFYWCARMAGTKHKKVGGKMLLTPWPGSQASTLWAGNEQGGNDAMIANLLKQTGQV